MKAKEVYSLVTKGTWTVVQDKKYPSTWRIEGGIETTDYVEEQEIFEDRSVGIFCDIDKEIANLHAKAIAVNNTFGKSINPESVEDMRNVLVTLQKVLEPLTNNPVHESVMKELNAAIEKSKL